MGKIEDEIGVREGREEIRELVSLCKAACNTPGLVQAGGGNASIKCGEKMFIKASGYAFSEVNEKNGYSEISLPKMNACIKAIKRSSMEADEKEYNKCISSSLFSNPRQKIQPRPSMESGMHAFLPRAVLHTHPVMLNAITCSSIGKGICEEILRGIDCLWLDYVNPGYQLCARIEKEAKKHASRKLPFPKAIILKNHGLIVSSESAKECIELTLRINSLAQNYLKEKLAKDFVPVEQTGLMQKGGFYFSRNASIMGFLSDFYKGAALLNGFVFPDDAVYFSEGLVFHGHYKEQELDKSHVNLVGGKGAFYPWDEKKSRKMDEMLCAKLAIVKMASKLGKIDYLKGKDVDFILGMESEKYRQKM